MITIDMKQKQSKHFEFYQNKSNDIIWWVNNVDTIGEHLFTFDKQKIYNLFADYPYNLTPKEKAIFDKENPEWADFFKDRNKAQEKYIILHDKTIFDFCNNESIINDLVVSKEDFFRDLKDYPLLNAHILIEYAELTNNKDLLKAVKAQYKSEHEAENNE